MAFLHPVALSLLWSIVRKEQTKRQTAH
jgi:hypothetical protein